MNTPKHWTAQNAWVRNWLTFESGHHTPGERAALELAAYKADAMGYGQEEALAFACERYSCDINTPIQRTLRVLLRRIQQARAGKWDASYLLPKAAKA